MYDNNNHPDTHRLSTQQHISLEKHQQMIDNALRWQSQNRQVTADEQRTVPLWLRTDFVIFLSLSHLMM